MMNAFRAPIDPLPNDTTRPLWSVMIPTYNCANYLREALSSVLAQDPGPEIMHIEVVDDCSTEDDPQAVVRELAGSRVSFYRQPHNVGHVRNFDTCLQRSRGQLIHLLHGDDYVRQGFYQKLQEPFQSHPQLGAAFCRHTLIYPDWSYTSRLERDGSGILADALERMASKQRVQASAMVVRREVYERLGGYDRRITSCGEDWEMWVRIAADYDVWYETEPLAVYRGHNASLTGRAMRSAKQIEDCRLAIAIYQQYLPTTHRAAWTRQARQFVALWAIKLARTMLERGDTRAALAQLGQAVRTNLSSPVRQQLLQLLIWAARQKLPGASHG